MEGVICERCGGSYELGSRRAVCPYCDHRPRALDVMSRGEAYEEAIAGRRAAAELELVKVARFRQFQRPDPIWLIVAVAALGVLSLTVFPALMSSQVVILLFIYVPVGAIFVRLLLWSRLPKATWSSPNALRVHCPLCGGPHEQAIDKALSRCQYCHASLAIGATHASRGLSAANDAVRQAALQHFRASRQWGRGLARRTARVRRMSLIWTSFVPVAVTLYYAQASEGAWEGISAVAGWAGISAVVLGGVAFLVRRRARRRAFARLQLRSMLDHYGGRWLEHADDVLEWLDVFWSDDYRVYDAIRVNDGAAAACSVRGYPALAIADPGGDSPFVELLIAASCAPPEGDRRGGRGSKSQREWLVGAGFRVTSNSAGVCAGLRGRSFRERFDGEFDVGRALSELAALAEAEGRQALMPG